MVLAVNAWDEDKDILTSYVTENKLKQRVLLNGSEVVTRFGVPDQRVPTLFWIDRGGVIVDVQVGSGGPEVLATKTKALLSKS